jgi:AhpD family alkylhydroperoxidase
MEARITFHDNANVMKAVKHINAGVAAVGNANVPVTTLELVKIRASQINGCGPCLEMHAKDALHAGEDPVRLNLVAAWREAAVFTEAEKAALELAEQGTRLADGSGVTDDVWQNATKYYDQDQLTALVMTIGVINFYNRLNVITRQPATGEYQPGQWG